MSKALKQLEKRAGHFDELEMAVYHMRLTDEHIAELAAAQLAAQSAQLAALEAERDGLLRELDNVIHSGHAPAYGELRPSIDLVDDYYMRLVDIIEAALARVPAQAEAAPSASRGKGE